MRLRSILEATKLKEQSQHYTVKHTPTGKTYKVTAMDQHSAKTKAAIQHGGRSASSRAEDQFTIVEGRMSDIHQDAQDMSKEEFTKKHPAFADEYDEINAENFDEGYKQDFKRQEAEYELRHEEEPKRDPKKRVPYRTPQQRKADGTPIDKKQLQKEDSIQAGDELMIESGMGEGIVAPVIHVVGENVLIAWDETADSLFEETVEVDEGEKHGNSKIYNKCWKGYRKVSGKSAGEKGSCVKEDIDDQYELFVDGKPQTKLYNKSQINAVQKQWQMKFPKAKIILKKVNKYAMEQMQELKQLAGILEGTDEDMKAVYDVFKSHVEDKQNHMALYGYIKDMIDMGAIELRAGETARMKAGHIFKQFWTWKDNHTSHHNEGRIEDTFATDTIDKHDKKTKEKDEDKKNIKENFGIEKDFDKIFKNRKSTAKLPSEDDDLADEESGKNHNPNTGKRIRQHPFEPVEEGDVINFPDPTMKQADTILKSLGITNGLNYLINKPFDIKMYELLIDAYMNRVKGTKFDNTLKIVISNYEQRGIKANELPPRTPAPSTPGTVTPLKGDPKQQEFDFPKEDLEEGEERSDIRDLMIVRVKDYLQTKSPGSYISLEDLESDLYDYASQLDHDDLDSPEELRNFMHNPGEEASSAVTELLSGMYHSEFDDYITAEGQVKEAEYQGRKVKLGKPTRGDSKKFKVYVKDPKTGNVKKVNFGHGGTSAKKAGQKTMSIKKSNPARRKSFRARHNCDNPGPRTKARYWSCRAW